MLLIDLQTSNSISVISYRAQCLGLQAGARLGQFFVCVG